jgi:hypothetical protein
MRNDKTGNAASWRDAPKPSHADVLKAALSPGERREPDIEIGHGQKIRVGVANDPQSKNCGPRASLLDRDGFGGVGDASHSVQGGGAVNMTARADGKAFDDDEAGDGDVP